ncbi:luxr bacterial regulatory protein hth signature [Lucifera butyrica]|uniref:Luxr bacterial regulatory protein hth signature n=1 Tax=Lucifera butyrica TaxID=1351585 RepID=A0A498RK52_9FIRM|nr:response regulator transcription factor [Lucifera butyrica]VBB09418.1 luxr bacterial regulatory protein hth signature [Lucifera butyrica]
MPISILIADDHAILRQGIKNVLGLEPDLSVVGEAGDGDEAVQKTFELKPDVVLLDINMPRKNGLAVIKEVNRAGSYSKIIALTIHDDENYVLEVVKAGAAGYLLKDIEPGMLVKAIRTVSAGESFIYPTLAKKLFGVLSRREGESRQETAEPLSRRKEEQLTHREIEVLKLTGQGLSNLEIAQLLFLSEKTVKNHLTNIFRKINVSDRTQAVLYAIKHKIVMLE